MSSRDNFKQAAKELFGFDSPQKDKVSDAMPTEMGYQATPADIASPATEEAEGAAYQAPVYSTPAYTTETAPVYQRPAEVPQQFSGPQSVGDYSVVDSRRETSIIAKGTTIVGRVRTDGHIEVMGKVEGNIEADGNVAVSGRVSGNIRGHHLELLSAQVKGNLTAMGGVFVSSDTVVIGDIAGESVVFDGRIKGNVTAAQSAEFNRNSYLVGDVTTKSISIEPGAVVNGMIRTSSGDRYDENGFEEFPMF